MVVEVRACAYSQRSAGTLLVGSLALTKFLPKKRSGIQRVTCGVDSDEVSTVVQVILKGTLTLRVQDYTEGRLMS